jgi:hypothetical protein
MSIDFHCHTLFSIDGSGTPEELVGAAAARGVSALSITEHNHLGSAARAAARAAQLGIRYFPGIELDAFYGENSCHFLGLGINPYHAGLRDLAERNHACYAFRFELFYAELLSLGFPWQRQELLDHLKVRYPGHPAPVLNTYLLSHFIDQKGAPAGYAQMREEALWRTAAASGSVRPGAEAPGRFCRFEEARDAIHAAGGLVLLAHVGKSLPGRHDEQVALIREMMEYGIDGFELYHHANTGNCRFDQLAELGRTLGCVISGGSDCHHAPGAPPKEIGGSGAPDELAAGLVAALKARPASGQC